MDVCTDPILDKDANPPNVTIHVYQSSSVLRPAMNSLSRGAAGRLLDDKDACGVMQMNCTSLILAPKLREAMRRT